MEISQFKTVPLARSSNASGEEGGGGMEEGGERQGSTSGSFALESVLVSLGVAADADALRCV